MKVYVISYHRIINSMGEFEESPWLTHDQAFTCKEHAEMEVKTLKSMQIGKELYTYTIDECTLNN